LIEGRGMKKAFEDSRRFGKGKRTIDITQKSKNF